MFDRLPDHHQRELKRIAGRLNAHTGCIVLKDRGVNLFCVVAANDVSLLRQAYFGPMNRSSKRKLRERLFDKADAVDLDSELAGTLEAYQNEDGSRPFLLFYFGKSESSKYAILRTDNLAHMEYFLYVSQRAFREFLYRRF